MPSKKKGTGNDEVLPKEGWAFELKEAERAARKDARSAAAQTRVAKAACKLRQWKKCKIVAKLGVSLQPNDKQRTVLQDCLNAAEAELAIASFVDEDCYRTFFERVMSGKQLVDHARMLHSGYTNLTLFHFAALEGDVRLLEALVALGAALDFPVLDVMKDEFVVGERVVVTGLKTMSHLNDQSGKVTKVLKSGSYIVDLDVDKPGAQIRKLGRQNLVRERGDESSSGPPAPHAALNPAPLGSTALLLACDSLARYEELRKVHGNLSREEEQDIVGISKCCTRLVMLGANFNKKLQLPPDDKLSPGLGGKTVKELATLLGKKDLIDAILLMETKENKIALTQCRCGSRLPWKHCHAGRSHGESPICYEWDDGTILWRYSPLAKCVCQLTEKTYYKCCWHRTNSPGYQHGVTGQVIDCGFKNISKSPYGKFGSDLVKAYLSVDGSKAERAAMGDDTAFCRSISGAEVIPLVRMMGPAGMQMIASGPGKTSSKSQMGTWDSEVYAGCMERIDDANTEGVRQTFMWKDTHWGLEKAPLLRQTKLWNDALKKYCDDVGLSGQERDAVIQRHTASPLAPCAHLLCEKFETKVKQFRRCATCKSVAYCSRECQLAAWKEHKGECEEH